MMQDKKVNVKELIDSLSKKGITLWEEGGKLKYKSPQGALNKDDLQKLKEHKEHIFTILKEEKKEFIVQSYPENKYEPFPLTDIQSAYLLGRNDAFGYGGVACHIYLEINYNSLEHEKSEDIWNKLVSRHDMLRAIIDKNGYQQVLEEVPNFKIPYKDFSQLENHEVEKELNRIRKDMGHRVYDTESWPLFSVAITKTPNDAILHFSIEFLIADWASIWLLLSEFEHLYYDGERELPELKLTFRDYLIAEKRLKESITYHKDKEYWMKRIDSLPPAPALPTIKREKTHNEPSFKRHTLFMDDEKWNEFKEKAKKHGVTPTVAVMSSYAAVIERWSSESKFSLNLTVLNRLPLHEHVNHIVGDFTSISLLDIDWQYENSFSNNAKRVSGQLFEDLDNRLFSGVEVLREIARRRGREEALMPIVFTSAIGLIKSSQGSDIKGRISEHGISQTPQVFIDCQAMDTELGLQVNWDVRQGIFPQGMIEDMFNAFEDLLNSLANENGEWAKGENVTLPQWQIRQREKMNDTKKSLNKHLLHSEILKQIEGKPHKVAVIDSNNEVTYKELGLRASAIADKLKEVGCKRQDKVAIIMDKGVHQIQGVLGVLSVGGVYVPIDTMQPEIRRKEMLRITETKYVLTLSTLDFNLPMDIKRIDVDKLNPHYDNILEANGDIKDSCYIIHTSGSTGIPKGVVISHEAAVNTIEDINERFNIGENDKILGLAQLSFDLSVYDIFGILSVGGTLIYPAVDRQKDPSHWTDLMIKHGVTVWNSVPALMQMLITYLESEGNTELPELKVALLSGDWIPLNLPDMIIKKAPSIKVISLGGATEAAIWSIFYEYRGLKKEWTSIPYGSPLANQGFYVLDKKMRDCPVWVPGELFISGDGLAKEYYGNKEITEASFIYNPITKERLYRTGDMGRYTKDDEIEFLGREDNQVKIKGHRIELGEIEAALQHHPMVSTATVVVEGKGEDRSLFAVVEPSNKKHYNKEEVKENFEKVINELNIDKGLNNEDFSLGSNNTKNSINALIKHIQKENEGEKLKALILWSNMERNIEEFLENFKKNSVEWLLCCETDEEVNELNASFGELKNVQVLKFDVTKGYRQQGMYPNDFNIVISNYGRDYIDNLSFLGDMFLEILRPEGWLIIVDSIEKDKISEDNTVTNVCNTTMDKWITSMKEGKEENLLCLLSYLKEEKYFIQLMVGKVKVDKEKIVMSSLIEFISNRVPSHMIPSAIQVVDYTPLTGNGKVNRKAIETWNVKAKDGKVQFKNKTTASDPLMKLLIQTWEEALNISAIDEAQSFYDCGADSLIMAQVTGKLRGVLSKPPYNIDLQFDLLLRNMLNHPTIYELGEFIRSKESKPIKKAHGLEDKVENKEGSNANLIFYSEMGKETLRVVFHEGLGSMTCFKSLIPHLINENRGSILGINIDDAEVYASLEPECVIETIAEDYANRLIELDYKDMQFIGYSLGGTIAVEVARRVVEKGVNLRDLILIDPHHVPLVIEDDLILELLFISNLNLTMERVGFNWGDEGELLTGLARLIDIKGGKVLKGDSISAKGDKELNNVGEFFKNLSKISQNERFLRYAEAASTFNGEELPVELIERLFKIFCQSYKAAQFNPMPYFGDIRMVLSKEPFQLLPKINHMTEEFWRDVCLGDLSVKEIEGNHFTCIAVEPNAANLAREIGKVFEK